MTEEPVADPAPADPAPADLAPRPSMAPPPPRPEIPALDPAAMRAARILVDGRPRLGRLDDVVVWAAGAQGISPPRPYAAPVALVFAGRHDAARYVAAADPGDVDARVAALRGADAGLPLRVLDTAEIRSSAGRIDREDALSGTEVEAAFALGREAVDREVDGGANLLLLGDVDADDGPAVAALATLLTGREPVACLPRDGDPAAWARAVEVVRDARRRGRASTGHPLPLLATVGGADLAALTGALVQAAVRRTPVLLDGPAATVCGLVAELHADGASIWWTAASRSGDPAHDLALRSLEMTPLLDLGLGYDGATAALLALPLLQAALTLGG